MSIKKSFLKKDAMKDFSQKEVLQNSFWKNGRRNHKISEIFCLWSTTKLYFFISFLQRARKKT